MMSLYIESIGLAAPGLLGWRDSQLILQGKQAYEDQALEKYKPQRLPPNERRRATELVRLAFRVCEEAVDQANNSKVIDETALASVFASSGGDYQIINNICLALCQEDRAISPTQFHNSVHNSAAGYWSIATKSQAPSTSLSNFDASFSSGLIEASTLALSNQVATLLATYDSQPPAPLSTKRAVTVPFGSALILSPQRSENTIAKLDIALCSKDAYRESSQCMTDSLEVLRGKNPAARILPLLEKIAMKDTATVVFEMASGQWLTIGVSF